MKRTWDILQLLAGLSLISLFWATLIAMIAIAVAGIDSSITPIE